ncbi:MAG: hypothetical protein H0Z39_11735 [Peptococcaceae bacterium]|nr:hypothetical protein [Peptococcaceae bacterium]
MAGSCPQKVAPDTGNHDLSSYIIAAFYNEQKNAADIARELHINKSTVTRTLKRHDPERYKAEKERRKRQNAARRKENDAERKRRQRKQERKKLPLLRRAVYLVNLGYAPGEVADRFCLKRSEVVQAVRSARPKTWPELLSNLDVDDAEQVLDWLNRLADILAGLDDLDEDRRLQV